MRERDEYRGKEGAKKEEGRRKIQEERRNKKDQDKGKERENEQKEKRERKKTKKRGRQSTFFQFSQFLLNNFFSSFEGIREN